MKAIIIELGPVEHAVDVIKRALYPDLPTSPDSETVIREELGLLLSIFLNVGLRYYDFDVDYECDYYEECEEIFRQLDDDRVWNQFSHLPFDRLEVLDTIGSVVLWLDTRSKETPQNVGHRTINHRQYGII